MSREEAIKQLDELKGHCSDMVKSGGEVWSRDVEALDMANKSLEAWEKVKDEIETNINNSNWSEVTNTLKWCNEIIDKHLKGVADE